MNYTEKFREWRLVQQRIKRRSKKAFFAKKAFLHKNDVQSIANGDRQYIETGVRYRVIFVDPGLQIDET